MAKSVLRVGLALLLLAAMFAVTGLDVSPPAWAAGIHTLQLKKRTTQAQLARIRAIKRQIMLQEKNVTGNILANQHRLESSKTSMEAQQQMMTHTRTQLGVLQGSLQSAMVDQQDLAHKVGKRIRSLYMGERLGFLHMVLDTRDISTLLDRMYYRQRVFSQDKRLYAAYIDKTRILESRKTRLVVEKQRLDGTIHRIRGYQSQLQEAMSLDKMLVKKLETSREAYDAAENQLERESYSIERQIMAMTRSGGVVLGSTGRFAAPVFAPIRSRFGYRFHPIFHTRRFHSGLDFGAAYGTPVRAADGGTVISAGWQGGYGKAVIINHGSQGGHNVATLYGHMSGLAVGSGQHVGKGQVVGYVGSTGYSTGPHLHFEVRINGRPVDPLGYLR